MIVVKHVEEVSRDRKKWKEVVVASMDLNGLTPKNKNQEQSYPENVVAKEYLNLAFLSIYHQKYHLKKYVQLMYCELEHHHVAKSYLSADLMKYLQSTMAVHFLKKLELIILKFKQVQNMDQFQSYDDFLANDGQESSISEVDFYKQSYKSTYDQLELKIQELSLDNERLKEDIGEAVIQTESLKTRNLALKSSYEVTLQENEHLKLKITTLKMENEKMITIVAMEKLLDTKLAQLENRVQRKSEHKISVDTPLIHHTPLIPVKSFHDECVEFVQQCTEWWCPVHSSFGRIVKNVKPLTFEDETIIRRAKARYAYWSKGDTVIFIGVPMNFGLTNNNKINDFFMTASMLYKRKEAQYTTNRVQITFMLANIIA
ncbi:hypothetical protein AGLY_017266 [Aphis glycines]|uniref:Uncharacterized protein n=1 Tax=Aphis glycines TaxID=307491 RepID=A0A6G0SVA4_APHGL|nr:hypothetical protein AGLY_017266 [Aphis glycines]